MAWAPDYVTSADLKDFVRVGDTADDVEVAGAITSASRAVDRAAGRQFGNVAAPVARTYTAEYRRSARGWYVPIDDLQSTTGLAIQVGGVAVTSYRLAPANAVADGLAWTALYLPGWPAVPDMLGRQGWCAIPGAVTGKADEVVITAPWGWSAFPVPVVNATKLQASRFLARRDSPYGVAGSPADGSQIRLLARVDPDVDVMLSRYKRGWWAA